MIENMVKELNNTTKRTIKIQILKKYTAINSNIAILLQRCYNPFEKFNVVIIKFTKVGNKTLTECYDQLNNVLDKISTREITGNMAKEFTMRLGNQLTKESQSILLNILNKDLKCGIGPETINAAYPGLIEQFSVQLANKYKKDKDYEVPYFWGSPKFDGIRCIYREKKPGILLTREGHEIIGFDNIISDCETLIERMKENPLFKKCNFDDLFIDGELFSDSLGFNNIQGIVLSTKNIDLIKKRQIYFKVFAIGPTEYTEEMVNFFNDSDLFKKLPYIKAINYFKVNNNYDEIMEITRNLVEQEYEGLMLRHPYIPYDWKRSDKLLKSKLLNDTVASLVITGYKSGKPGTKYENMLGSFTCSGTISDPIFTDGKRKLGEFDVVCEVGSGFSDEERTEMWNDPDYYIGKEIIVNYQCMSQNSVDNKYSLRFGIKKKGFKLDRTSEF